MKFLIREINEFATKRQTQKKKKMDRSILFPSPCSYNDNSTNRKKNEEEEEEEEEWKKKKEEEKILAIRWKSRD